MINPDRCYRHHIFGLRDFLRLSGEAQHGRRRLDDPGAIAHTWQEDRDASKTGAGDKDRKEKTPLMAEKVQPRLSFPLFLFPHGVVPILGPASGGVHVQGSLLASQTRSPLNKHMKIMDPNYGIAIAA